MLLAAKSVFVQTTHINAHPEQTGVGVDCAVALLLGCWMTSATGVGSQCFTDRARMQKE